LDVQISKIKGRKTERKNSLSLSLPEAIDLGPETAIKTETLLSTYTSSALPLNFFIWIKKTTTELRH
jgi:hypothetical protein